VTAAIRAQNAQVSAGTIGDLPNVAGPGHCGHRGGQWPAQPAWSSSATSCCAPTPTAPRAPADVARIELGAQNYATSARLNGKPSTGIGVQLSPTGNALATAKAVRERMDELSRFLPPGHEVGHSLRQLALRRDLHQPGGETLLEAVALVFLVMFLFLQNWRYTIIPTIVVPVALLGTFATLLALGFSINVLTMFGMVLVIGIVVDDAIVVVENVERIMSEEGLPPLRGHAQGHGPDLGRHHRRHRGADLGVRAAGLLRARWATSTASSRP
jgi:multidrug efflux pump